MSEVVVNALGTKASIRAISDAPITDPGSVSKVIFILIIISFAWPPTLIIVIKMLTYFIYY